MRILDHLNITDPSKITPGILSSNIAAITGIAISFSHAIPMIISTAASTGALVFYVLSGWVLWKNRNK